MGSILLVAYGNVNRGDDGVAFHVIYRLRQKLGLPVGKPTEAEDDLDSYPAMLCKQQLTPELAQTLREYERIVFIDAHVAGAGRDTVHWEEIAPAYRPGIASHRVKPATLLALCHALYNRQPQSYILSILGTDFALSETLSPKASAWADQAVEQLYAFVRE